jgi:tetratricopeptide (TPR) repeat protein
MNAGKLIANLVSAIASIGFASGAFGQDTFAKANQEYAAGHFREAIDAYQQLVRAGDWSANLFYDLGNACFHTNDFGHAILNYERALALEPRHPEAQANLRIVRDEARALEIAPGPVERAAGFATVNQYAIGGGIAFWVGVLCLERWIFSRRRSSGALTLTILSLVAAALAVAGIFLVENGTSGKGFAIVTGKDVTARLATADTAESVLALPPGSEIKILSKRGDWVFAALPNGLRGWIPAKDAEAVRL